MGFSLREIEKESKFVEELTCDALAQVVSHEQVREILEQEGIETQRKRKLNMEVTVYGMIAVGLYENISMSKALSKLAKGLRYIWPEEEGIDYDVVTSGGWVYRRYQLGARPMAELFHQICKPIATEETVGAFLFGYRLMAIDGTVEDVADTPENVSCFGRHSGGRGESAFPQLQGVYLAECGTHAVVDAGFWPIHTSERIGGLRMLRSIGPGMLVMWDRGFHSFDMVKTAREKGAHVLGRLPSTVNPQFISRLDDGSYLAYLVPSNKKRRKAGERIEVRIIEYTIKDPNLPGYGETHRLVTTLLDIEIAPAYEVACAYYQRWEIEVTIDEVDTHLRINQRPVRSKKPVGVIQELYAVLVAHFIIRSLMLRAAHSLGTDPDRLSFTHALEVFRDSVNEFQMTDIHQIPRLFQRLINDIAQGTLPPRRNRSNPRVIKRKMSKFLKKRPEHYHSPQPTMPFNEAISLI